MKLKMFALLLAGVVVMSGCSQGNDSTESQSPSPVETSSSAEPSIDPCQVFTESQAQLTDAISDFASNPSQDVLTTLSKLFDAQVEILSVLVDPLELEAAIALRDEALAQYEKSQGTENVIEKGMLLAGAALSASEAIALAQSLLSDLNEQYDCNE
jgi:PBP1b-binding outer membrane lipoprotein LpoB